jgi:hypothetical protein
LIDASVGQGWAVLRAAGGSSQVNVTVGGVWDGVWRLQAVIDPSMSGMAAALKASGDTVAAEALPRSTVHGLALLEAASSGGPIAIVELESGRWGTVAALAAGATAPLAVLRQGTGAAGTLEQSRFNMTAIDECYYSRIGAQEDDFLAQLLWAETPHSLEPTVEQSLSLLPPTHDYQLLGVPDSPLKWVAAQNGIIKRADGPIYTPLEAGSSVGTGTVIFNPETAVSWPPAAYNWTDYKASRLGRVLSTMHVGMRLRPEMAAAGAPAMAMTLSAFAPSLSNTTQVLVRTSQVPQSQAACGQGFKSPPCPYLYWVASNSASQKQLSDGSLFYTALLAQNAYWLGVPGFNSSDPSSAAESATQGGLLEGSMQVFLPGQEGQRLADMGMGMLVSSQSVYLGLTPNYGFGEYYWSPELDKGGSLPLTTLALNNALLDWGLYQRASELVGFYWETDLFANGTINLGNWKPYCSFADGLSDYGRMLQLWTRTANAISGTNASWVTAHYPKSLAMAEYMMGLLAAAPKTGVAPGLIIGPAEHDTCTDEAQYFSINMWMWRGLRDFARFLNSTGMDEPTAIKVSNAVAEFEPKLRAAVDSSWVANNVSGNPLYFLPPIAGPGQTPFPTMTGNTIESYSNFRYFSETLLAGFLRSDEAAGLSDFRTTHGGSVSGITRWSDHLDDMPAAGYARASLELDRMPFFHLFLVGLTMNYQSRGVFASTEQIGYFQQPSATFREYLAAPSERDMDMCVPSSQLVSELVPWSVVADAPDDNIIWLLRGSLRRWFNSTFAQTGPSGIPRSPVSDGSPTLAVRDAHSRYGRISMTVTSQPLPAPADGFIISVDAAFNMTGNGYIVDSFGGHPTQPATAIFHVRSPESTGAYQATGWNAQGCDFTTKDPVLETVTMQLTGAASADLSAPHILTCSVQVTMTKAQ